MGHRHMSQQGLVALLGPEECTRAVVRSAVDEFSSDVIDAVDMLLDEVSWNDASWSRMVNMFFLREINAHRLMRSNLWNGSASVMRMLIQESDPRPDTYLTNAELRQRQERRLRMGRRARPEVDKSNISTAILLQAEGPARSD